jgi:hypothetical protein
MRFGQAQPTFDRKLIEPAGIFDIGKVLDPLPFEITEEDNQHGSDGVNRLVAGQTIGHQTAKGRTHRQFIAEGNLVLDSCLQGGVGVDIGELDSCPPVIFQNHIDSCRLIESEPGGRVWGSAGIIPCRLLFSISPATSMYHIRISLFLV